MGCLRNQTSTLKFHREKSSQPAAVIKQQERAALMSKQEQVEARIMRG